MKKTYISPELLVVKLASKRAFLEGSLQLTDALVEDEFGGWIKEENSPITDKSIWDEEW